MQLRTTVPQLAEFADISAPGSGTAVELDRAWERGLHEVIPVTLAAGHREKRLASLRDRGVITPEEFQREQEKVLA